MLAPALVMILLALPAIGQGDFHTDSHVYVAVVLGMLRSGDFIHPMLGNVPYHNKPPLGFWIVLPFITWLGPTLVAVRLAMMVVGAACAAAVGGMARELVPARVALSAALVFALTHEIFRYTHAFSLDLPLTLLIVLSVWCVLHASGVRRGRARSPWWVVLGGVPMGMALMVKPLLGLIVLIPIAIWLVLVHRARLLPWLGGLVAVAAVIAAPWHLEMIRAYPSGSSSPFLDTYLFSQSLARLTSNTMHVTEPWWYYFEEMAESYQPWALFLLGGLVWVVIKRRPVTRRWAADSLALLWGGVWIGLMSLSAGKSMRYIVPVYPALSLFVGGVLVYMPPRDRRTALFVPAMVALVVVTLIVVNPTIHDPPPASRAQMLAAVDAHAGDRPVWISPDQIRWGAYLAIERGAYPLVAQGPTSPTGAVPQIGDVMLYRSDGLYAPRAGDERVGQFDRWVVTVLGRAWDGAYTQRDTD